MKIKITTNFLNPQNHTNENSGIQNFSSLRKGRIDSLLPEEDNQEDETDYDDFENDLAFEMDFFLKEYVNRVHKQSSCTAFAYWICQSPGDFGVHSNNPKPLNYLKPDVFVWDPLFGIGSYCSCMKAKCIGVLRPNNWPSQGKLRVSVRIFPKVWFRLRGLFIYNFYLILLIVREP
jgi:hypothetical protein